MTWHIFKPATLLFLGLWLVLLIGGRTRFFQDPGTFWHTVTGQKILETGHLVRTDPFTFTFGGQPWVAYEWLGESAMAIAFSIDGFDTLLLATATILAALFTWLGVRLIRCGLHPSLAVAIVAIAVGASSGHFHVRPHLATMVGLAVTMAVLCDVEAKRKTICRLAWLIPMFWIWSNIHGGVLGGLATFALAIAGWFGFRAIGWESPVSTLGQACCLVGIFSASAAMTVLGPFGIDLPEVWIRIYQMKALPPLIREHAAINLFDISGLTIAFFGLIYAAILASTWPNRPRIVWLIPLVWLYLACMRVRHGPLFAITALVVIADLFPKTHFAARWLARSSDLFELPKPRSTPPSLGERLAPGVIPVVVVALALYLQASGVKAPVIGHGWAQIDPANWPVDLLPELRKGEHDRPNGTRIFNEYEYGGFLIYYTPGYRVFVDDRWEVFGDQWLSDFINAGGNDPEGHLKRWQAEYGPFDYALVGRRKPGLGFISYFENNRDWELVKETDKAALFRHR